MTGLIYLVIIALWAAVLIPVWLRRHDQISEVRSTARFTSAMRSLGSPGQVQYADTHILDRGEVVIGFDGIATSRSEARMARPEGDRPNRAGLDPDYERELVRQAAATRRAVVLGALTALLLVTLVLAFAAVLPKWAPAIAVLPVGAFIAATVATASTRSTATTRSTASTTAARRSRPETADLATAARGARVAQTDDEWENWNAWDDDSWEAQPTTLPTYVSAPRASAVPRGIDRATPGEWTGEAMVQAAREMRRRPTPEDIDHGAQTAEIPVVAADAPLPRAANG